jgi:site-specific recombinase XerD
MTLLEGARITEEMMGDYLEFLRKKGRKGSTIASYQWVLNLWYVSLPKDKILTADALGNWERELRQQNISEKTLSARLVILKGFLSYLGYPIPTIKKKSDRKEGPSSEIALSREEYHLLLYTAKEKGHRRAYLLIKTIASIGIGPYELKDLTVEGVEQGLATISAYNHNRAVKVYEPLRSELLAYVAEAGVKEGPVFFTKTGGHMISSAVWKEVKFICRRAGLSEEKGLPKNLHQLYINTRKEIAKESAGELEKNYLALLQEEESIIGWNKLGAPVEERKRMPTSNLSVETHGRELSKEEADRVVRKIGDALSEILQEEYACKVTIAFTRKEEA